MCTVFFLPKHLSAKFSLLLLEQRDLWGASSLRAEYLRLGRRMSRRPCTGGGGFGLSRTGYPVETSTATVVWQQSTNTLLWRCIASWMETKTVTTPRFSSDLRSAEVCKRLPQSFSGGFVGFRLVRSTSFIVQYFPKAMNRAWALWILMQDCFSLYVRGFYYRSTISYKGQSDARKKTTHSVKLHQGVYVHDSSIRSLNAGMKTDLIMLKLFFATNTKKNTKMCKATTKFRLVWTNIISFSVHIQR